ncbi:TrbI/VirB10 family protein [Thalassospira sp.]|uniref:TrbI/VirB10 family protein n=1 Tax=Thalassospira sp. TaxID=1912094 RepID=UPI002736228E|nr:TrbI/VirB10 family protein [Thalassospira sp.]MDP2699929.1 TrbI/VirB10 family protein [Thalassospira sp.]
MSALCDIALVIGLTFNGLCVDPEQAKAPPTLPADDETAWALPAPPPPEPPAPEPAPPRFPPVIIKQAAPPAPPPPPAPEPEPVKEPEPAPMPAPDPYRLALQAAMSRAVQSQSLTLAAYHDPAVSMDSGDSGANIAPIPKMDRRIAPDPLDLKDVGKEPEDYQGPRRYSTLPVDNTRKIAQDRYISVQLETGINSQVGGDQPGSVILQTTRDVFGYHGRMVLLPKGSRMICSYQPPEDMGSSQLSIQCDRVLIAGHRAEIIQVASNVTNQQGWLGVAGEVDNRFWQRYGNAFLLTGISTAVRYAAASTKTEDADGQVATAAAEKASEELSTKFGEITADMLERTIDLKPIITIPQGTRLQIRPATDWYIKEVE